MASTDRPRGCPCRPIQSWIYKNFKGSPAQKRFCFNHHLLSKRTAVRAITDGVRSEFSFSKKNEKSVCCRLRFEVCPQSLAVFTSCRIWRQRNKAYHFFIWSLRPCYIDTSTEINPPDSLLPSEAIILTVWTCLPWTCTWTQQGDQRSILGFYSCWFFSLNHL